jgi:predicted permease
MGDDYSDSVILAEGYQMQPGESLISPNQIDVSDGFLEAMHMSLVRGRAFTSSDTATSTRVALIDERLAAKFWPGRDPIGRRLYSPTSAKDLFAVGPNTKYITVVGVLREVQLTGLGSAEKKVGAYYFPLSQSTSHGFILALRTNGDPLTVVPALRQAIARLDPELPVYRVRTMTARVDESLLDRRVPMLLATGFGIVALLLSAIGIYGVLASGVAQRRREIGIRLALGSTTRQIFGLVLGDGARIVGIGLAIGLAGALAGGRLMNGLLYGVRAADPVVIGMAIATLAIVGFLAIVIPARRATKVSPIVALSE